MLLVFFIISQIEIEAELNKQYLNKKLTIGDPFEIILTLTYPQNTDISEPFVDSIEPFGILDQKNKIVQEKGFITNTYATAHSRWNNLNLCNRRIFWLQIPKKIKKGPRNR